MVIPERSVAIIGAGLAGLSVGALLAREGYHVRIFEKSSSPGGRAGVIDHDGVSIDFGLHLNRFASQGSAQELFTLLGEPIRFFHPGPVEIFDERGFHRFPAGVGQFILTDYIPISKKLKLGIVLAAALRADPAKLYATSLRSWLGRYATDPEIISFIELTSAIGLISLEIGRTSAGEFVSFIKRGLTSKHSTGYPEGGFTGIIERLKSIIGSYGGKVLCGRRVDEIVIENGRVGHLVVEGKEMHADTYIFCASVAGLPKMIRVRDAKLTKLILGYSKIRQTSGIEIDFLLDSRITKKDGLIVTKSPPTLGMFISNTAHSVVNDGMQLGYWLLIVPSDKISDKDYVEARKVELKELLATMFPGIWGHLEWERLMVLKTVDGAEPILGQTVKDRMPFQLPGICNLYFCGDTTRGEGGGGDIAFDSAIKVSRLLRKE